MEPSVIYLSKPISSYGQSQESSSYTSLILALAGASALIGTIVYVAYFTNKK